MDPQVALLGKAFVLLFSFLAEQNPVLLVFYFMVEALCTVSNSTNKVFLVRIVPYCPDSSMVFDSNLKEVRKSLDVGAWVFQYEDI